MIVHVFFTWQGDKRKEEGRQKYIIRFKKKKKGITGKGSSFIQVYYTPKGLSYHGPKKATRENRKTSLSQRKRCSYFAL